MLKQGARMLNFQARSFQKKRFQRFSNYHLSKMKVTMKVREVGRFNLERCLINHHKKREKKRESEEHVISRVYRYVELHYSIKMVFSLL